MNAKSKVIGLLAAIGLTLSLFSAASATPGDVDLVPGDCILVVNEGSFDFGIWKWNGPAGAYQLDSSIDGNDGISSITWNLWYPTPQGGYCWVNATSNGFFLDGDTGAAAITDFSHKPFGFTPYGPLGTASRVNGSGPSGWQEHFFRLNSVPNTYVPGNYSGTIEITVSNTAP